MDIKGLFANVPKRQQYVLFSLLGLIVLYLWWAFLFKPAWDERDRLKNELASVEQQLYEKKMIAANLPRLEAEIRQLQAALKSAIARLPEEKEIPALLTQVNSLGEEAGLVFTLFRPQALVRKDFYAEIPIQVRVEGTFHALRNFFDRIGKMERIVTIGSLSVSPAPTSGQPGRRRVGDTGIIADFSATTFTFIAGGG